MPDHEVRHFEQNLVAMEFAERFLIVLLAKLHELLGQAPLNASRSSKFGRIITFFALLAQRKQAASVSYQVKSVPF